MLIPLLGHQVSNLSRVRALKVGRTLLITIKREISPDLTMVLDKRGGTDLQILPQGGGTGEKEVQEVPAPEAKTPGAVIDDAEDGSDPISECSNPSDWNQRSHE